MASKMMELDICGLYLAEPQRKSLAMAWVIARDVVCLSGSCSLAVRIRPLVGKECTGYLILGIFGISVAETERIAGRMHNQGKYADQRYVLGA